MSALDRYAVLSLREKALCGMSLKRHLAFIPICDVTINNCDLVVSNLTEKIHRSLINHVKTSIMMCGYLDLGDLLTWYSNWKLRVSASRANVHVARLNWGFEVTKWTVNWSDVLRGTRLLIGRDRLSQTFSQTASDWVT